FFIDLKKAFDVIDHSRLLRKLSQYGIRGVAHQWVKTYLEKRKQFVQIKDHKSKLCEINCGVPQGSVLGPKLFILFINNLVNVSKTLGTILFADDTTLFYPGSNTEEVAKVINDELIKIKKWFDINRLTLNLNKTNFVLFHDKKNSGVSLEINGIAIQRVKETKFLGVLIDEDLTWKSHISYIKCKIAKSLGVLHRVKFLLTNSGLLALYNSLVVPYLTYCVEIWGATYKNYTQQKRALRIISYIACRDPSNLLLIKYKLLKFHDLKDWNILQTMYKANLGTLSTNIQGISEKRTSNYMLKETDVFTKPRFRTKIKEWNISVNGVKLWNNLKREIKKLSFNIFIKCTKLSVLNNYENVN
uniref:Reverse transcriptase domain-containing protein n=1 Tax=Nothobranchius furzeri TaxID=105023 RepID=A0A8C6NXU7_NOTFU